MVDTFPGGGSRHESVLSPDWKALLDDAESEREVVSLTRDFLATWTPEEIHALPAECRPGHIRGGDDVTYWAFEYARIHCATPDDPVLAIPILKLRTFFSHAAARLSQVSARRGSQLADQD